MAIEKEIIELEVFLDNNNPSKRIIAIAGDRSYNNLLYYYIE